MLEKLQEVTDSFIDPQSTSLAYAALAVGVQASIPDIFLSQRVDSGSNGCERARPIHPIVPCGVQATLRQRNDPKNEDSIPASSDAVPRRPILHSSPTGFRQALERGFTRGTKLIFATLASSLVDST